MNDITIQGLTARQRKWADILWLTEDQREITRFCALDRDARIVRDLIVASSLDQVLETELAERALVDIFGR